ncbi:SIMPL domain-containing protein [Qipengyuania marisflavi]|uniref:DUF541 domain-containing protein n=1 Tax=Qipengyuania marisflavi TaxID=2486356 RepID=A0A5S3P9F3_9SPHN|nr:SIMPL domain-containing protein [Qipengyuania marisflavi]TMM50142.1 DUF541 domain-containing protein [Qipengyuania marisflavi]
MRKALPLLLAGIAAALPLAPLAAQNVAGTEITAGHTLLTVNGEGKTLREPELAVFSAGVTTQGASAAEALGENSRKMSQVIASLKRAGIAERDIQTSNLSISPVYANPERDAMMAARASGQPYIAPSPENRVPRIISYTANNTVSVRQRKLGDYGKVIDTLATAGANQINGPAFQMDDPEPALNEARRDAVRSARAKAELYASAAGLRIVRVVSISESGGYYGRPPQMFGESARMAAPPPPPAPIQPGEMQMSANVSIQYELAP